MSIMKIKVTNEDRQLFREVVKKHGIVKESLLMTLFAKVLGHQIEKAVKNEIFKYFTDPISSLIEE